MHFEFLKTQELTPAIEQDIEAFLDRQNNSNPFQFPGWMVRENKDGPENRYCAIVRERAEIRWFAHCGLTSPLGKWLRSIRNLTVNRGPACDDPDLALYGLRQLVQKCRELGFAYLTITPEWVEHPEWTVGNTLSLEGWQSLADQRSSLRLNLAPATDQLLRSFRKDTRLHIRRSEGQGVVIRPAENEPDIQEFQRIYFEMASKKNFSGETPTALSHALRWIVTRKDRGDLLLASKDSTPLGGVLVVRAASRAWGVFSATIKDTGLAPGHLIQWSAVQWAKEHGCLEYDFGGYREGIKTGPASFKRGFCDTVFHFSPSYKYAASPRLCSILDLITKARSKLQQA